MKATGKKPLLSSCGLRGEQYVDLECKKRTVNGCACPVDGGRVCKPSIRFLSCTDGQGCARPGVGKHFDSWTTNASNI